VSHWENPNYPEHASASVDLPVQGPTKYELMSKSKTAKAYR